MEDTSNHIMTKPTPGILDIKPVEELQGVQKVEEKEQDLPEIEDATPKDIFIRPQKPVKKKKQLSERQRAHLQRLREMKVIKKQEREKKKAEELKKQSMNNIKKPLPEPVAAPKQTSEPKLQQPQLQRQPTATTVPQPNKLSNQQYMSEFFNNMNMFIEAANKYTTLQSNAKAPAPAPAPKPKPAPAPKKQEAHNPDDSYYVDFLKPQVGYDYKNPFGF